MRRKLPPTFTTYTSNILTIPILSNQKLTLSTIQSSEQPEKTNLAPEPHPTNMASVFRPGATALITGGASGIGFAFAQLCQSHGMHLAIVDINPDHLSKAKETLSASSTNNDAKIETYQIDVSQLPEWHKLRSDVENKFGGVDLLMLNAGASFKPQAGKQSWEDMDYFGKVQQTLPSTPKMPSSLTSFQTFATNLRGPLNGISTFLPLLQQNNPSGPHRSIILTGSKQGITNPPGAGNPAYNASKAAVKSLAEHLAHDLRSNPNTKDRISVHLLIPGWTYTSLTGNPSPTPHETSSQKPTGAWLPSQVASYAYEKITKSNSRVFYIVCPDDDVDEALDAARMKWGAEDVVEGRPALSRWDEGWKDRAAEWIEREAEERRRKAASQ